MVMMELKDVAKNYGRVTAVAGVSFQVLQGEILLIIKRINVGAFRLLPFTKGSNLNHRKGVIFIFSHFNSSSDIQPTTFT